MSADSSPGEADAAPALLQTKLHAPRRRAGTVERRRLIGGTAARARPRLILVSAPAGFGKTTLLTEWFTGDSHEARPAWLSLDPRDNDPTNFWSYVIASLRGVIPGIGASALDILRAGPSDVISVVAALVGELESLEDDVVLVLDDYHVIDASDVHDSIAFLLDHLPERVSVAIATRVDPPFPLARFRARGELVERRAADLRFTHDEAAEYLNNTMGLELTADDVDALETRTEGWVAALQLAALSMQGREDVAGFIASFTGDDRFVVDYLVEEVLERQPPELRRFLLETSVLGRLVGPLCDAVTGGTSGRATLERLDRANLFLVPLDDRREWYRYHHLFADVLRARLLDEQPELVSALHRRAAAWLADHDDAVEAIEHAMAAEDFDVAAALIERTALGLHRVRQEAVVRRWLEALPPELFAARPVLSVLLVASRMATGDPTGVDELLTGAESWIDAGGAPDPGATPIVVDEEMFARLPAQIAVYRAALALLSGDIAGTMHHAERALALTEPEDHLQRGSATALAGLASWTTGDLGPARTRYAQAVEYLVRAEHFADALGCSLGLADMCRAQGRLNDAIGALTFGLDLLADHSGLRGAADMHAGLSELYLERNELARSREHLDVSVALGERAGLPQHPYRWRVATARLAEAQGDFVGALELLHQAERVYDTDYSPSVRPIPALRARVSLAQGDLDSAVRWADRRGVGPDDDLSYVSEFDHVTLARTLVARQIRDREDAGALGLLERLLVAAENGGRNGVVVETLALIALVHHANGDRASAAASIGRALALAEPEGHVRVFTEQGAGLAAFLRSVSFEGAANDHCRRVLAAFSGEAAPGAPARHGLVDELSSRELDVLRLLRSELSGPEIARELIVSLNTLRTHTKNIYAKLGVTSRREAVRRADELGL